ncbi:hypothetical protein FA13DRAFT_1750186 [Coprinellus micaceus]|uniref:Uncharacterized protein n=1 Tax=Coprinellus micaceus TaxID=71717 RepID=A0A4Y7R962_COPMI|nr:hypothetical protein FA13DRAFT_1750186 [Coprinellus micaceus]
MPSWYRYAQRKEMRENESKASTSDEKKGVIVVRNRVLVVVLSCNCLLWSGDVLILWPAAAHAEPRRGHMR